MEAVASRAAARNRRQPAGDFAALQQVVERFAGPAALVAADGRTMAANAAVAPLAALLAEPGERLRALIAEAAQLGTGCARTIVLPGVPHATTLDIVAVPVADGTLLLARDLSLEVNLRATLVESRRRYKDLVEISSDFAWETDAAGAFLFVSPKGALGWPADYLVGRAARSFLVEPPSEPCGSPFSTLVPVEQVELWFRRADGVPACLAIAAVPMFDATGVITGARGVCRDVTEARERDAELAEARNRERLFTYILRAIRDEVEPGTMLASSAAAIGRALGAQGCRIWRGGPAGAFALAAGFGAEPDFALDEELPRAPGGARGVQMLRDGTVAAAFTQYRHAINGRLGLWRAAGQPGWSEGDRSLIADIADQLGIAIAQIGQHEALAKLAGTDGLTGLMNRRSFVAALGDRLGDAREARRRGALLYLDLDNFKLVNDLCGHKRGDEALQAFARLVAAQARGGDLVARLGGDEFAVWLQDADAAGAAAKADALLKIRSSLADFAAKPDRPLTPSVGVALHGAGDRETVDILLARADAAMYQAKRSGRGLAFAPPPTTTSEPGS